MWMGVLWLRVKLAASALLCNIHLKFHRFPEPLSNNRVALLPVRRGRADIERHGMGQTRPVTATARIVRSALRFPMRAPFEKGQAMTNVAPGLSSGLGAFTRKTSRRLFALVTAGALVLAGLSATATPAKSDTTDDLLRLFLGIAALAVIVHAIDDNRTPRHVGRWTLPDDCRETVRIRGRHIDTYNTRCLERAGYHGLPQHCRLAMHTDRGQRPSYLAQCLYDEGYHAEQRHYRPRPEYGPGPGYRPRPDRGPGYAATLPRACEMVYRESGRRVEGYDGHCLESHRLYQLPRHCRVSDRSGRHYYNAQCLSNAGYYRAGY